MGPIPKSVFRSEADLPFVRLGEGMAFQLLQIDREKGLWVVCMRFDPGVSIPRHKHTGEVLAYTISGAWKYRDYPDVYKAGSYVHEPAGAEHTLEIPEDNKEATEILFINYGVNINYDEDGNESARLGFEEILQMYRDACREQGYEAPRVIGA